MIEQRFWDKVTKTSSCWFWTGAKRSGYGIYTIKSKNYSAHRITYEDAKGKISGGLEIDHVCMNRNCVNPEHLEAVDRAENLSRGSESAKYPSTGKSKKSHLLYIHDERFRQERRKSGLINQLLAEHYNDEEPVSVGLKPPPVAKKAIQNLADVVEEEPTDFYKNLTLDITGNSGVWDDVTQEHVDADPEMIKELKKRGQVK